MAELGADAGVEVHQRRVVNGYGSTTSLFSPSNIGLYDASALKRQQQSAAFAKQFEADAHYQRQEYSRKHPFKKQLHLQKCYPQTVKLLDGAMAGRKMPKRADPEHQQPHQLHMTAAQRDKQDKSAREYQFVHTKMEFIRHRSKDAAVNKIITGKCPQPQHVPLFPVGATHEQLLGIMKHNSGHPEQPAPPVPRPRRWLGDAVGWEP